MRSTTDPAPLLEARGIGKRFPGVQALRAVDLVVGHGEVVAVIGENGAGKSTLMKVLAGVQEPDEGEVRIDGRAVRFDSVRTAEAAGVALIHQELNLCDNLAVGESIFLGREPRRRLGFVDRAALRTRAAAILARLGLDIDPGTSVASLSIGQQQLVEIGRALSLEARLLILDEPTSALSTAEAARLFEVVRELRGRGVSVVYISHRLGEVEALADRVVVLRDGENAGELARDEISHGAMVRRMVGRDVDAFYSREPHAPGDVVLDVAGLRTAAFPDHAATFQVRAGEIVGLAGLVGAGRSELLRCLFGVDRPVAGGVTLNGTPLRLDDPRHVIAAGAALVPEDRKQQGLFLEMSVRANASMAALRRDAHAGWIDRGAERRLAAEAVERLSIRCADDRQAVGDLSGGNQQKVVLGRWLAMAPALLLLDEPTRGIDIGAKEEIYGLIDRLAGAGLAILFASSEMEEVLGLADRVLVLHEGRVAGELTRAAASEEAILHLATGGAVAAEGAPC